MTVSPLISSPLRSEISAETYQDEERRLQIVQMRQLLNSDWEEYTLSQIYQSQNVELEHDGTATIAQTATFIHPQEIKLVQVHRPRRSQDSDTDTDSESSFSLAETLVNQTAEQIVRDHLFRQTHGDLAYDVEVPMANARADQERLRNWIGSMQSVVEKLERRRKSDARLDASLQLLEQARSVASPRRRSTRM